MGRGAERAAGLREVRAGRGARRVFLAVAQGQGSCGRGAEREAERGSGRPGGSRAPLRVLPASSAGSRARCDREHTSGAHPGALKPARFASPAACPGVPAAPAGGCCPPGGPGAPKDKPASPRPAPRGAAAALRLPCQRTREQNAILFKNEWKNSPPSERSRAERSGSL